MEEEGPVKKSASYVIGQPLDTLSIEDLEATVAMLKTEIDRLEAARTAKTAHRHAADALFGRK